MRQTQRAPRRCSECAERKIKCNKVIPCDPCKKRGTPYRCRREVVSVRGRMTVAINDAQTPPAERLEQPPPSPATNLSMITNPSPAKGNTFVSLVKTWNDIILPTPAQSLHLVRHGKVWTAWIHCALYYPEFEAAHKAFWDRIENHQNLSDQEPFWLAIYFANLSASLLTQDQELASSKLLFHGDQDFLMRSWYSASLFCLDQADYRRNNHFMGVQALAILQMCCEAVGDGRLRRYLLVTGLQLAIDLGMPFSHDSNHSPVHSELSRRLWWVFVLCEWFAMPGRRPLVFEETFDMILPLTCDLEDLEDGHLASTNDSEDSLSPWVYHLVLCKTSLVKHRFNHAMNTHSDDIEAHVKAADVGLADIIDGLPSYLQPDAEDVPHNKELDEQYPWLRWQRIDLVTNLFLNRATINYECRTYWHQSREQYAHRRAICLESARTVISLFGMSNLPIHQRRYMTYTLRLHTSGLIIASEIPFATDPEEMAALTSDLSSCIHVLEQAIGSNDAAEHAVGHLSRLMHSLEND